MDVKIAEVKRAKSVVSSAIYEPKGAALEYSPLACNLWLSCTHGCQYCYAPAVLRKSRDDFYKESAERPGILAALEKDCKRMQGDKRPVLLCFCCDPYQPHDIDKAVTRKALEILEYYHMTAQVLTKGGTRAVRDFDLLQRNGWKFGTTLSCYGSVRRDWEPGAASPIDRIEAIMLARELGIKTWVSVEPVIDTEQALDVIRALRQSVDFWKIGKMNHYSEVEKATDWSAFLRDVRKLLKDQPHYIKTDLLAWEKV